MHQIAWFFQLKIVINGEYDYEIQTYPTEWNIEEIQPTY
jgi:hypothetical protein